MFVNENPLSKFGVRKVYSVNVKFKHAFEQIKLLKRILAFID